MDSGNVRSLQRMGPSAELVPVLRELGVDPARVFEGLPVSESDLRPDNMIPFADGLAIFDRAVHVTGVVHLGALVGARNDERCLGPVGDLMRSAPTLGDALADYIGVQGGVSQAASVYLHALHDGHALGFGIYSRYAPGADQIYGVALAAGSNIVASITGGKVRPAEVLLSHRAPEDPRPFERVFGCRVRFNQDQSCIVLPPGSLATALPHTDPARRRDLIRRLRTLLAMDSRPVAVQLRHVLRPLLSTGITSLEGAADALGLSTRTLDRLLLAEKTSFAAERDAVRYTMARELLGLTDMPVGNVAMALSYATPSAFVRAFRRWSGVAPRTWRVQSRPDP